MKKKSIIIVFCIAIFIVLYTIWIKGRNVRMLENLDITTLSKVTITGPIGGDDGIEITEQEDIKKVVDLLQSMHLNKVLFPVDIDGFLCDVSLYYKNGDMSSIIIRKTYINIDSKYYTCDRNYCDAFRKLYEELSG